MSAVMGGPYINYGELDTASYPGDARLIIWTLAWANHAVLDGRPLFDANIFYPTAGSLAYNEHLFGLSLFTLPIYALTANPVLAYNVVWLAAAPLNGLATHALLRRWIRSDLAAVAGSVVFTFSFYKMLHAHGHLAHVWTWAFPLSILLLERWRDRPSFGRAALWAVVILLQVLTSWYLAVMILIVQAIAALLLLPLAGQRSLARHVWQLGVVAVLVAGIAWPFAQPYRVLPEPPPGEVASYAADLDAYLVPPENTWPGQLWLAYVGKGPRWIWGERTLYLGWIALAFAAVGALDLARRREWRLLALCLALVLAGFSLSLGPALTRRGESWSAFGALTSLPGMAGIRAPARFALVVLLGVSGLAAFGAACLARARSGRLMVAGLVPLMLSEFYVIRFPLGKPQPFGIPAIYRVETLSTARALVSLPSYRGTADWFYEADYLYFSTAHWRPIVNGFGRAEPPDHQRAISHMSAFPGPNNAKTMRELGVDYVVFHSSRYSDGGKAALGFALDSPDYRLVARVGPDYLFAVVPAQGL